MAPLHSSFEAGLLDLDGVLYLASEGIPHAADAVRAAREVGMRVAFVTNNASRRPVDVARHLCELGIPAEAHDVVTSAEAAAALLRDRLGPGATVLVVGSEGLADAVREAGLLPVRSCEEAGPKGPAGLVQGLSADTAWRDLAEACVAIRAGALWVAGNVDPTYPSPRGALPGNGAFVVALSSVTGRAPLVVGKPEPGLHREAVERVESQNALVVGDRLDTDVLGAVTAGAPSLLVLTGVTDLSALLAAPAGMRPSFVATDLRGLCLPQPPVVVDGEAGRCGDVTVQREELAGISDITLSRERLDPGGVRTLRAACALSWSLSDSA
ncbi:MAG: HAD-IIA family hydrolase [Actinomycetota bacterium]|nr:HAD-IIA family hydrolase [Actinomycetota bacterium]